MVGGWEFLFVLKVINTLKLPKNPYFQNSVFAYNILKTKDTLKPE